MSGWIDAAAADEMIDGDRRFLRTAGREIALFRVQGRFYALEDRCPHAGSSLVVGKLDGTTVTCQAHGLRFDLATGCMRGVPGLAARAFPVRVRDGRVQIDVGAAADTKPQFPPLEAAIETGTPR